jgi:hypothetical protein
MASKFDDVLQLSNRKLAIKIDVENYECNVLSGMEQTLRNNRCIIQVETFNDLDQVRSLLGAEAYQLVADFFPNFVFSNTAIRSHWNASLYGLFQVVLSFPSKALELSGSRAVRIDVALWLGRATVQCACRRLGPRWKFAGVTKGRASAIATSRV